MEVETVFVGEDHNFFSKLWWKFYITLPRQRFFLRTCLYNMMLCINCCSSAQFQHNMLIGKKDKKKE